MIESALAIAAALYTARFFIREGDSPSRARRNVELIDELPRPPIDARGSSSEQVGARMAAPDPPAAPTPSTVAEAPPPPAVPAAFPAHLREGTDLEALVDALTQPVDVITEQTADDLAAGPPPVEVRAHAAGMLHRDPDRLIQTEILLPSGAMHRAFALAKLVVGIVFLGVVLAAAVLGAVRGIGALINKLAGA